VANPQVTIVVVPRERFSHSERSLINIYENTSCAFKLAYVSAGTPAPIKRYLEYESQRNGFQLISTNRYLTPNQARNLGLREVNTKYVVFLDNDALVTPGWLEALLECAEETGAWVVGPLYLIGELARGTIHMAGGKLHIRELQGKRILVEEQSLLNMPLFEVTFPLRREPSDYMEFHCMLVRTDIFDRIGSFDEDLLSVHEHIDFCLAVRNAGGSIYVEPKAVTTYIPPPPCEWWDIPYYMLRWSEAWNLASVRHFNKKWGVSSVRHISDKSSLDREDTIIRFARGRRRLLTGLRVSPEEKGYWPEQPLEQAELMVAMFQSVDRDCFDLALTTNDGSVVQSALALDPQEMVDRLPHVLRESEDRNLNVMIRPRDQGRHDEPILVRLDDLSTEDTGRIKRYAFMTLETSPNHYQCWIAVDRNILQTVPTLSRLAPRTATETSANHFVRLAGSPCVEPQLRQPDGRYPRVQFVEGVIGFLATARQLEGSEIQPFLFSSRYSIAGGQYE
jgi:hypothetical protein